MDPTFDEWVSAPAYPTLFRTDREVCIDLTRAFPGLGDVTRRQDELPLWVRACGVRLELAIPGRLVAWVRRADGGWLANCVCWPTSANGQSPAAYAVVGGAAGAQSSRRLADATVS